MLRTQKGFLTFEGIIGLVILFGFAYILVVKVIWEPMQDEKESKWRAFSQARSVQTLVRMYHDEEDLKHLKEPLLGGTHAVSAMNTYVAKSGESINTGYHPMSRGHALALSNRVLTGDDTPTLLDLLVLREELDKKGRELAKGW